MHKFNTLQDVIDLATLAHQHDRDKAGEPYIKHPLRVMRAVQDQGAKPYVQMAGVLHDVPEDTRFSHDILLALGVPEAAVTLTRLLDRNESKRKYQRLLAEMHRYVFNQNIISSREGGKAYTAADYVLDFLHGATDADEFYYFEIRKNPEARMIKLADIADNMLEWRRSYLPQAKQDQLAEKYAKARRLLGAT